MNHHVQKSYSTRKKVKSHQNEMVEDVENVSVSKLIISNYLDLSTLSTITDEGKACRRFYVFSGMLPAMFSNFDGYLLNNTFYELEHSITREQLNKYLLSRHGIKGHNDGKTYSTHLPDDVTRFGLKPSGFLNPESVPPNFLITFNEDYEYQFIVKSVDDNNHYYMGASEITGLIRDVAKMEYLAYQFSLPQARGVTTLDNTGSVTITLPTEKKWDKQYTYQLSAIGVSQPNLYISSEVAYYTAKKLYQFKISGGIGNSKVSWVVEEI